MRKREREGEREREREKERERREERERERKRERGRERDLPVSSNAHNLGRTPRCFEKAIHNRPGVQSILVFFSALVNYSKRSIHLNCQELLFLAVETERSLRHTHRHTHAHTHTHTHTHTHKQRDP